MSVGIQCEYSETCGGCSSWGVAYDEQVSSKASRLRSIFSFVSDLPEIRVVGVAPFGVRDRADLQYRRDVGYGLFEKDRHEILAFKKCLMMSPGLDVAFQSLVPLPIDKASVRIRVSPSGQFGLWIDCANTDVKFLLDEQTTLETLQKNFFIEIGQRKKVLIKKEGQIKLGDPEPRVWFETYYQDRVIPLYCSVGSFTQPGFKVNHALVDTVMGVVDELEPRRVLEFGCGIGNFTIPLLVSGAKVVALESDALSLLGLEKTLNADPRLAERLEIKQGDFQKAIAENLGEFDLALVDPPRSGLKGFVDSLINLNLKNILYISCYPETLSAELGQFLRAGFKIKSLNIVDQFPQSDHMEVVTWLEVGG